MKDINLYLIRHGQTEWNLKDCMQGSQNSPLTENGIEGAKITGRFLKDIPFVQAYSSPQQRAVETRDYIVSQFDNRDQIIKKTEDGLREMDFGAWEGEPICELIKIPEFSVYMHEPEKFDSSVNQGENYPNVLERMKASLDTITENAPDHGNILIVSHGTALRLLLCVLTGGDWRYHRDEEYFPRMLNTSISLVNYQQQDKKSEGKYTVHYFNNVDHL